MTKSSKSNKDWTFEHFFLKHQAKWIPRNFVLNRKILTNESNVACLQLDEFNILVIKNENLHCGENQKKNGWWLDKNQKNIIK